MNQFSYAIDIKQLQDMLETSVDEAERRKIERLLTDEKARATLQAPELQASEPKQE